MQFLRSKIIILSVRNVYLFWLLFVVSSMPTLCCRSTSALKTFSLYCTNRLPSHVPRLSFIPTSTTAGSVAPIHPPLRRNDASVSHGLAPLQRPPAPSRCPHGAVMAPDDRRKRKIKGGGGAGCKNLPPWKVFVPRVRRTSKRPRFRTLR